MTTSSAFKVPVLIVGGGPCGMLLSALLSRYRVPSLLLERGGDQPMSHPRAHVLNARSMEILRKVGIEEDINAEVPPREDWSHFRYCESLLGDGTSARLPDFAFVDHLRTREYRQILSNSPCRVTQISQPILEKHIRKLAMASLLPESKVLFNHTVEDVNLQNKTVAARDSRGNTLVIEPDVVIAGDGARSLIREKSRIALQGKTFLESFVSVHFTSSELGRRLRSARKTAMLTFVFNPDVIAAVVVAHDARGEGNFVAHLPFFPPAETAEQFENKQTLRPLLERALSTSRQGFPHFEIKSVRSWGMHATLAERMSSPDGFVGLIGDAAHQYPPSGGFGVNVGIGEVDYLATKIAEKMSSLTSLPQSSSKITLREAVLEFARDRHPIAKETLKIAIDNYNRGLVPAKALGLERHAVTSLSTLSQYVPSGPAVMRSVARIPLTLAIRQPDKIERLRRAVEKDFSALPLFFPQVDLGVDVKKGVLVSGDEGSRPHAEGRLVRHAWFRDPSTNRTVSTLDLINPFASLSPLTHSLPTLRTIFCQSKDVQQVLSLVSSDKEMMMKTRIVALGGKDSGSSKATTTSSPTIEVTEVVDRAGDVFFNPAEKHDVLAVVVGADGYVRQVMKRK